MRENYCCTLINVSVFSFQGDFEFSNRIDCFCVDLDNFANPEMRGFRRPNSIILGIKIRSNNRILSLINPFDHCNLQFNVITA